MAFTIFQRIMQNVLSDISKAVSRLDDIPVAGIDEEDHLHPFFSFGTASYGRI